MVKFAYMVLIGILLVLIWQDGREVGHREGIMQGFQAGIFTTTPASQELCIDKTGHAAVKRP